MPNKPAKYRPKGWKPASKAPKRLKAWSQWYSTPRWRKFRRWFFAQIENATCSVCGGIPDSIDHTIPHEGSHELFWDVANMTAMCKGCHSSKTGASAH